MENNTAITKEKFYKEIRKKHTGIICEMIRGGILEEMDNEELKDVFRSLMKLRDREIVKLLAQKSHYFPMEMLDVNLKNRHNKDFISQTLTKYKRKFQYKIPENAGRLFKIACMTECKPMLLFTWQGLAEDNIRV